MMIRSGHAAAEEEGADAKAEEGEGGRLGNDPKLDSVDPQIAHERWSRGEVSILRHVDNL
jgi:hypothetical protein